MVTENMKSKDIVTETRHVHLYKILIPTMLKHPGTNL
jgi:hypothetical protein